MGKESHNRLQDLLRSEEELPQEFVWDEMGVRIMDKMETKVVQNKLWKSKLLNLGLTAASIISITLFVFNYYSDEDSIQSNDLTIEEFEITEQFNSQELAENIKSDLLEDGSNSEILKIEGSYTSENDFSSTADHMSESIADQGEEQKALMTTTMTSDQATEMKLSSSSSSSSSSQTSYNRQVKEDEVVSDLTLLEDQIEDLNKIADNRMSKPQSTAVLPSASNFAQDIESPVVSDEEVRKEKLLFFESLAAVTVTLINKVKRDLPKMKLQLVPMDKSTFVSERPSRLTLLIGGGTSYSTSFLSAPELNSEFRSISEKGLLGYGALLALNYDLGPKWSLKGTVAYDQHYSKLDYYNSNSTRVGRDVLVRNETNSLTGETTAIYEYRLLDAIEWDKVIHYNSYKYLTTALQLQRNLEINKSSSLALGMGLQYNRLLNSTGKTIGDSQQDNRLYEPRELSSITLENSAYGLMSSVGFNFDLSTNFLLGVAIDGSFDLRSRTLSDNVSMRPIRFRPNVSLGYRL